MADPIHIKIPVAEDVEFTSDELRQITEAALRAVEPFILAKQGQ